MSERPIDNMMETTLQKIKEMVDANTIIGKPVITPEGSTIIPVSKISYGFASGGSEFSSKNKDDKNLFGGGSGAGVTVSPIAFLTVNNGEIKLLHVEPCTNSMDRLIDLMPGTLEKIGSLFKKKNKTSSKDQPANQTENK